MLSLRNCAVLKKRLVGVITVKDGWAVQSIGYNRYLPLGRPEILVENLDRWGADEILLQCIDRSVNKLGPDFELLERINKRGIGTPLIYSGGIRSVQDGVMTIRLGADRISLDALLMEDLKIVDYLSYRLGAQALIAALPLSIESNRLYRLDYRTGKSDPIPENVLELFRNKIISEAFIIDWKNEGKDEGFNIDLLHKFPLGNIPLIAFGGLTRDVQIQRVFELQDIVAVAIGNSLNYSEQAIFHIKRFLHQIPIRVPGNHKIEG